MFKTGEEGIGVGGEIGGEGGGETGGEGGAETRGKVVGDAGGDAGQERITTVRHLGVNLSSGCLLNGHQYL